LPQQQNRPFDADGRDWALHDPITRRAGIALPSLAFGSKPPEKRGLTVGRNLLESSKHLLE
jgi:hypothetical protein